MGFDSQQPIDEAVFSLALEDARRELNMALGPIAFDPAKHPRNLTGQFRDAVKALHTGQTLRLPDGTSVFRTHDFQGHAEFQVQTPEGGTLVKTKLAGEAAVDALDHSAGRTDAKSVGGATSHANHTAAIQAQTRSEQKVAA